MRVLYWIDADGGGILAYAVEQAKALERVGLEVTILHRQGLEIEGAGKALGMLPARKAACGGRMKRVLGYVEDARASVKQVVRLTGENAFDLVLLDCFREYLSPFWVGPLRRLRERGQRIGVINHDPVRDFVVGPKWWHDYSIRSAMSCFTDIFVHDARKMDWGGKRPEGIRVHQLCHGPFRYPVGAKGRAGQRAEWGVNQEDFVFLSFGQVRDGKQLDLVLRAMTRLPDRIKLVVAGKGDSQSQRPVSYYQELARELGIAERCHWENRYIGDEEVSDLFEASDAVLTTYSNKFVSASGVLSTAVAYQRPVLASSGGGPMETALRDYAIGEWVRPGDAAGILEGMGQLSESTREKFDFAAYTEDHSWEANARCLLGAIT